MPSNCTICACAGCSGAHTVASLADFTLITAYIKEGWSQSAISRELNISRGYVAAIAHGWDNASLCEHCGVAFFPKRTGTKRQRFDKEECAHAFARGEQNRRER